MYILVVVVLLLLLYLAISYTFGKPHPKFPPGPIRWPIWGGYIQLLLENFQFPHKAIHWMARRYNTEVLGLYLGPYPTVVACSSQSVRELLTRPEFQGRTDLFIARARSDDNVIRGQFFLDGPEWVEQRRFLLRNLRDFGFGTRGKKLEKVIEEEIKDLIDLVQSNVEGICQKGEVVAPTAFYPFFINITLELLLGTRFPPYLHAKLHEFAKQTLIFQTNVDPTSGMINMTPWLRHITPGPTGYTDLIQSNKEIKKFIQEMVNEHKETFIPDSLRDYCDVYLKAMHERENSEYSHFFSEDQMIMSMWDLLFPSAMAVTSTMGFAVQYLLYHPEVQKKMQKELDDVVGMNKLPTLDDRPNLPYIEAVFREVQRRETLTGLGLPHRCTEDTYFHGYFIPKDTIMLANLWSSHMDDRVWDNPFEFRPERHLESNGTIKKKDLTNPFGLGKRVCAGETFARQNMLLVLMAIMQNFTLELPEGHSLPDLEDHLPGLNTSPRPFKVNFVPR